jgi:hypothetical protein
MTPVSHSLARDPGWSRPLSMSPGAWVCGILSATLLVALLCVTALMPDQRAVALPTVAILAIFAIFSVLLAKRLDAGIFGELGFLFLGFCIAYSVIPAINFLALDFNLPPDGLNFAILDPQPAEIGLHLWRHALFIGMVAVAYLVVRGRQTLILQPTGRVPRILLIGSLSITLVSTILIAAFSAPVANYYEHYNRFEHLTPIGRYAAYIPLLLKSAGYYVTLILMFSAYQRYKYFIPPLVLTIVAYEMLYSYGSRIESLFILMATACLYHHYVRPLRLVTGATYLFVLLLFFTGVEFYRAAQFDINAFIDQILERGSYFAYEFGAVFYTSFHIYHEKALGTLPQPHWLMLINDFFTAVPMYDHVKYNSQYWYADVYFPDSIIPPQTMGPLADSGIWGGEIDLAVRGLLTGLGYAYIARWVLRRNAAWHQMLIYTFFYATLVFGLKYSIVYQASLMVRIFLPVFILYCAYIAFARPIRPAVA